MGFSIPVKIINKLKAIACYQIAGGFIGAILIVWTAVEYDDFSKGQILFAAFTVALFGFSIFCGLRILKGNIIQALNLSVINQSLQLISFSVFGYAFKYASGLFLSIGFDYTNDFLFSLHFGLSSFTLNIHSSSVLILLEINLVAVYILWVIQKLKKNIETGMALFNSILPPDNLEDVLHAHEDIQL